MTPSNATIENCLAWLKYGKPYYVPDDIKNQLIQLGLAAGDFSTLYVTDAGSSYLETLKRFK